MDWRYHLYGSSTVSRTRRILTNVVFTAILLAVYGAWTEFLPSDLSADVGSSFSGPAALLISLLVWHGIWTGRIPWGVRPKRWIARVFFMAAIPFLTFGLLWFITVRALPDIATQMFGVHMTRSMHLEASYRSRGRACDHQLRGPELPLPGYICVQASEFDRFAARGDVIVAGKSTVFGMHVTLVEPGANK